MATMNPSSLPLQAWYRVFASALPFRWVLAATCVVTLCPSTSGCLNIPEYGIGTACDEVKACREPLVCSEGYCAPSANTSTSTTRSFSAGNSGVGGATASIAGGRTDRETTNSRQGGSNSTEVATTITPTSPGLGGSWSNTGSGVATVLGLGGTATTDNPRAFATSHAGVGGFGASRSSEVSFGSSGVAGVVEMHDTAGLAGQTGVVESLSPTCLHDSECSTGNCVDGYCCDSACTEQCEACNLEGHQGRCMTLTSGQPVGKRTPCINPGTLCGGSCSGELSCSYPDSATTCNESSLCRTPFTRLDRMACDGLGYCAAAMTSDCFPSVCNMNTDGQCGAHVYTQVDVSESHSCAVTSAGIVKCWGSNVDYGVLGLAAKSVYLVPTTVEFLLDVKQVAAGWGHTCALQRDGAVQCWGTNFNGDLGCTTPTRIVSDTCSTFPAGSGVSAIVAGGEQSCALMPDGKMRCWGRGELGQIGDGGRAHRFSPTPVADVSNAVSMTAGIWHVCAVVEGGAVKCWGENASGKLGVGTASIYPRPSPVIGIDGIEARALAASAGIQNTCFLLDDQRIRCSGLNDFGQLGNTQQAQSWVPVVTSQVPMTFTQVTVGGDFVCALDSSESVQCWGRGTYGTLGNGEFSDSAVPVNVSFPAGVRIKQIAAKYNHACAVDTIGSIWCWGDNSFGQLGDGTQKTSSEPVMAGPP